MTTVSERWLYQLGMVQILVLSLEYYDQYSALPIISLMFSTIIYMKKSLMVLIDLHEKNVTWYLYKPLSLNEWIDF